MIHLVVAVVALFEPAVGGPAVSPSADDVLRMLRRFEPCRIESSMVLEASFQGRVERSRPLEAIYVVAPPVDDGEARALLRMNGYRTIVDGAGLSITHEEAEDVFVRLPSGDSPLAAIRSAFRSLPDPMLDLMLEDGWGDSVGQPSLQTSSEGGFELRIPVAPFEQITLVTNGDGRLDHAIRDRLQGADGLPDGMRLRTTWSYRWDPLESSEADAAVQFDREGRQRLADVAALAAASGFAPAPPRSRSLPAPDLELSDLDEVVVQLRALQGQIVVLDFWATWCTPCRTALRSMQSLADEYGRTGSPVRFLAINVHERGPVESRSERVSRFVRANELDLQVLMDDSGVVAEEWDITSIPVTIIVDADGDVVHRSDGFGPGAQERIRSEIERLLARRPKD